MVKNQPTAVFSQLQMLGSQQYILIQGGWSLAVLVDISDPINPRVVDSINPGLLYSRNICNGNVEQGNSSYSGVFSRNRIIWYDGKGNEVKNMASNIVTESDGAAAMGDKVLVMSQRGYVVFDPLHITESNLSGLPHYFVDDVILRGKPTVYNNLLVLAYGYGKVLTIVDISDVESPQLIAQVGLEGNPDVVEITDEYILVPMRRQGLLMLMPKDIGE